MRHLDRGACGTCSAMGVLPAVAPKSGLMNNAETLVPGQSRTLSQRLTGVEGAWRAAPGLRGGGAGAPDKDGLTG